MKSGGSSPEVENWAPRLRARPSGHRLRAYFNDLAPFGGYKQSGIGREMGLHGLAEYTETKHVHVGVEANPDAKRGHRMLVKGGQSISYQYEPRTRVLSGPGSIVKLYAELDMMKRALVVTDAGVVGAGCSRGCARSSARASPRCSRGSRRTRASTSWRRRSRSGGAWTRTSS